MVNKLGAEFCVRIIDLVIDDIRDDVGGAPSMCVVAWTQAIFQTFAV